MQANGCSLWLSEAFLLRIIATNPDFPKDPGAAGLSSALVLSWRIGHIETDRTGIVILKPLELTVRAAHRDADQSRHADRRPDGVGIARLHADGTWEPVWI